MSLSTYYLEYGRYHSCHAYVPTSNAASHDNHEKINSWISFSFLYEYGSPLGGPDHVYLRHLSTEYRSILSAESMPIYRPHSADISTKINRHTCRLTPPLGRYFTDTQPTLPSFAQLSLLSSVFSAQLRGLSGPSSFFGVQFRKHSCLFSSYVFFLRCHFCIQPSLLSEVAAFWACCLRRFVILGEQKMIYKVSTTALLFLLMEKDEKSKFRVIISFIGLLLYTTFEIRVGILKKILNRNGIFH